MTPARDDRCLGKAHKLSVPSEVDGSNLVSLVGYRLTCKAKALVMEFGREVTDVTPARSDRQVEAHKPICPSAFW